jgi:hypothetical protein
MAGLFGSDINNKQDFLKQLETALAECPALIARHPQEDTLRSVQLQLEAIKKWIANDRQPTLEERKSLNMAQRMFREYEMTDEIDISQFRDRISSIHSYVRYWPTDRVANDENNDEYLFPHALDREKRDH